MKIITDSASDITLKEAADLSVDIVPLTIQFEDGVCKQETAEDIDRFYERLLSAAALPTTAQPSPELYLKLYRESMEKGEEVLVLTLSGGLSGTINAVELAKEICGYDKIEIVDTHQAIISQRMLVEYAVRLRDEGNSAAEIGKKIADVRDRIVVCGVLDTLTFLKKGGRIPPALAVLGNMLRIKPVIVLRDSVLDLLGKARGSKAGRELLYKEMEARKLDPDWPVFFGYTVDKAQGEAFMEDTIKKYGLTSARLYPVGGVIGTHVGPNCIAVAFVRVE